VVEYGHAYQVDPTKAFFAGGDLPVLTIDLTGYSSGSTATLTAAPAGAPMLQQIHDAAIGSSVSVRASVPVRLRLVWV
jgi:hypothetical protein